MTVEQDDFRTKPIKENSAASSPEFSTESSASEASQAHVEAMKKRVDEQKVAQYLHDNPEFFSNWENLLSKINLPHQSGKAVSLVEKQVSVLRDRNIDLRHRLNRMLELAKDNDELFFRTRDLSLALMEATNLEEIGKLLNEALPKEFDIDAVSITLYQQPYAPLTNTLEIVRIIDSASLKSQLGNLAPNTETICSPLRENEAELLFTNKKQTVGSAALVPLSCQGDIGVLAIGSFESGHFTSDMGTLFIDYLGQVLSRVLRSIAK